MALRADCENLVKKTIELLGGIDVIISNAVRQRTVIHCSKIRFSDIQVRRDGLKFLGLAT